MQLDIRMAINHPREQLHEFDAPFAWTDSIATILLQAFVPSPAAIERTISVGCIDLT
jgi:hypothetical protein